MQYGITSSHVRHWDVIIEYRTHKHLNDIFKDESGHCLKDKKRNENIREELDIFCFKCKTEDKKTAPNGTRLCYQCLAIV